MVPDTPDVEAALFGDNGVAEGLPKGKTVVDMSSISPVATKDFARRSASSAATTWTRRCPAAKSGAKAASLTIMVGGPPAAFERVSRCSS